MRLNSYAEAKVKYLFSLIEKMDDNRSGSLRHAMVVKIGDTTIKTKNYNVTPPFDNKIHDELGNEIGHIAIFSAKPMPILKWGKAYHRQFSIKKNMADNDKMFVIERNLGKIEEDLIMSGIAQMKIVLI